MVMAVCGHPIDQAVIGKQLHVIERKGCSSNDIARYLSLQGLPAEVSRDVANIQPLQIVKTGKHFMLVAGRDGDDYVLVEPLGGMFTKRDEQWFKQSVSEVVRIQKGQTQCVL
jgi:predicted double-glycine peptidase